MKTIKHKPVLFAVLCAALAASTAFAQDSMQGMDMSNMQMPTQKPPVKKAKPKATASASATSSGEAMQPMPGMPMTTHERVSPKAKRTATPHKSTPPASKQATPAAGDMQGMDMSSMPGMQMPQPAKPSSPASASSAQSVQGTDMSSMPGMQMSNTQPMPKQPRQPAEIQHLHFGNMIGTRPKPGGLAGMETMPMPSMQGGEPLPDARDTDYSDGYTYGPMRGMDMADDESQGMVLLDQLEFVRSNHGGNGAFLEGKAWYGKDFDKLWLKAEGDSSGGQLQDLRTEALWAHAIAPFWDTQLGLRHDFGVGPGRTWAAFGVEGMAPYWFDTEATFYAGQDGRTAARLMVEYEEPITQRLILQPMFEANTYGKDDPQRGIGSGLSDADLDLRLRYEIRREFAPYIGIVFRQRFGRTADLYRAQGERANELQFVAGVRIWF